jgi:hypothetical protein
MARIGLAVPPLIFSGRPMKRKRPRPTTLSRLARHSMCVMPRPALAMCALNLSSPSGTGLIASAPNMLMPRSASQWIAAVERPGKSRA